jgi:uncharacterized protein involved in exopolysaccharide biosynthesis/Mrp family chromosome partitioning ATPase
MNNSIKRQVDFNLLLQMLKKKKWLIFSCISGVLIPIFFYTQKAIPVYETKTSIIYERFNGAMNENSNIRPIDKNILNNVLEEIKSDAFTEDVVKSLPEEIIKSYKLPDSRPPDFNITAYLTKIIRTKIGAENIANSDVIEIRTRAASPITAQALASTITEVLKQRNLNSRQENISNVRKVIEDQLDIYAERLKTSEEALRSYKEKDKISYLDQESFEVLKRITEAEIFYNKAQANRESSENRLKFVQKRLLKDRKELVPSVLETSSPLVRRFKEDLINLEIEYTKLKVQNYPESHPKMVELNSKIDQTMQRLTDEALKITKDEKLIDPLSQIQRLMEEIIQVEIEIETYRAQEKASKQVLKDYEKELQSVPEKELTLARLIRERDVTEKLYKLLMEKREEARINEAENLGNIRVLDPPRLPEKSIWPKKELNIFLGIFLGIILSMALITILELLDKHLKTVEQISKVTDINVIGNIPRLRSNTETSKRMKENLLPGSNHKAASEKLIWHFDSLSYENEAFRRLRTNLQFLGLGTSMRSLLVTSSLPAEGKSLIASNLAISIAQMGLKILLVDADFRKPSLHQYFNQENSRGLLDLLRVSQSFLTADSQKNHSVASNASGSTGKVEKSQSRSDKFDLLSDFIRKEKIIIKTTIDHFDLISAGKVTPDSAEMMAIPFINYIIEALKQDYDIIILDSPPTNVFIDASLISSLVDMVLLVVKTDVNTEISLSKAKEIFTNSQARNLGIITNYTEENHKYVNYYSKV